MNDQYDVKTLYSNIFKTEQVSQTPWPRMILCAVATLFPILAGIYQGELSVAIYGGLAGYLLALNDHLGSLRHRFLVMTLSAIILTVGFSLGFIVQGHMISYYVVLAAVTYWIGLLGGEGAELERAVLFALVGFITAVSTPGLSAEVAPRLIPYAVLAYVCLAIGGPVVYFLGRHQRTENFAKLRNSLRQSFTKKVEKHAHAICFVATVMFSVWLSRHFTIEHGSWVTITVLIVLRPDRLLTVYKTLQRFLGTLLGVLVADVIIMIHPPLAVLIMLLAGCAFVIPWAMIKNYWITSFFVTIFVVVLLEIAAHSGTLHMSNLRLEATFIGCVLSLLGVALARVLDWIVRKISAGGLSRGA